MLEEKAVISVQTWGLSDKYTWLAKEAPRPDNQPVAPMPWTLRLEASRYSTRSSAHFSARRAVELANQIGR